MDEKFAFSLLWPDYERGRNTEHEVKAAAASCSIRNCWSGT